MQKELTKEDIDNFKLKLKASKIDRFAICRTHAHIYQILQHPKDEGFEKSVKTLIDGS